MLIRSVIIVIIIIFCLCIIDHIWINELVDSIHYCCFVYSFHLRHEQQGKRSRLIWLNIIFFWSGWFHVLCTHFHTSRYTYSIFIFKFFHIHTKMFTLKSQSLLSINCRRKWGKSNCYVYMDKLIRILHVNTKN